MTEHAGINRGQGGLRILVWYVVVPLVLVVVAAFITQTSVGIIRGGLGMTNAIPGLALPLERVFPS